MARIIAYIVSFSLCSAIGRTVMRLVVNRLIQGGIITSASLGATIITAGYVVFGLFGVLVVYAIIKVSE